MEVESLSATMKVKLSSSLFCFARPMLVTLDDFVLALRGENNSKREYRFHVSDIRTEVIGSLSFKIIQDDFETTLTVKHKNARDDWLGMM